MHISLGFDPLQFLSKSPICEVKALECTTNAKLDVRNCVAFWFS